MAGYTKRPAPKPRSKPVNQGSSDFFISRDTTQTKAPTKAELDRMKKLEYQRKRNVI
jgi:hypothetical protein